MRLISKRYKFLGFFISGIIAAMSFLLLGWKIFLGVFLFVWSNQMSKWLNKSTILDKQ
jgi:hypothetical protein